MNILNDEFRPQHVQTVVLDLINNDQRKLAWELIDYYFERATELIHFDILGFLSLKVDKRDTYLKCAQNAYSLAKNPEELYVARTNLYKAYNTMNLPEEALFYINLNLKLNPEDIEAQCHKACNISLKGDKITSDNMLLEISKKYPDKVKNIIASKLLREGKTADGILNFVESVKLKSQIFETELNMKAWKGNPVPGQKLYVNVEGGIGDLIINIRFFDILKKYGMHPILFSYNTKYYKDINNVLSRHGYDVLTDAILIDRTKKWIPLMSIPGYLKLQEKDLWHGTYLTPLRKSKNKLSGDKFKIGIKCSGNPYFAQDEYRKIPIENMLGVLPKEAEIYYIDIEQPKTSDSRVISLSDRIESWEDTLDFIDQMDCIVSSCTSLVHAAGAMGKITFVAVPIAEYYIWTTTRTDGSSPWYGDNFYVAKQTKLRDWTEPLEEIGNRVYQILRS